MESISSSESNSSIEEVKLENGATILVSRQDIFYDDDLEQEDQ
jgi:hypothetical protein